MFLIRRDTTDQSEIHSLAVMPLRALNREAEADYLGLAIADTIIMKVSQAGDLPVRPTSSVRRYVTENIDSLDAARKLQVDAVLDGTLQRSGDRLRLTAPARPHRVFPAPQDSPPDYREHTGLPPVWTLR